MNLYLKTKTLTLTIALAFISNVALADSAREWGYWDAATAAGSGDGGNNGFANMAYSQRVNSSGNTNPGNNLNNEQNSTRLGRNVNVPSDSASNDQKPTHRNDSYVGYTFCLDGCGEGSASVGKFDLEVSQQYKANYVSSNKRKTRETAYYDSNFSVSGIYNDIPFEMENQYAELTETTRTNRAGKVLYQRKISTYGYGYLFSMELDNQVDGQDRRSFTTGTIIFDKSISGAILGTPLDAKSIVAQLRLGQTYNFRGRSVLGSRVNIAVDFQNASWKGRWSKIDSVHNGFRASGDIDGSSLLSSKVKGLGKRGVSGFVKSGRVDATLVGVIKGTDASKAGVIGSTVVTVKQIKGVKSVGDVFSAKAIVK